MSKSKNIGTIINVAFVMLLISSSAIQAQESESPFALPFTQEEYSATINKIICSAMDDFADLLDTREKEVENMIFWKVKEGFLEGAFDTYIFEGGISQLDRAGKDFAIGFISRDSFSRKSGRVLFKQLVDFTSKLNPECGIFFIQHGGENPSLRLLDTAMFKTLIFESNALVGKIRIEIDFMKVKGKFYTYIHVFRSKALWF